MDFEELSKVVFEELKAKLEEHSGISIFARERAKFEGWLKVEVCDSLSKYFKDVVPERDRVDITFEDWGIELKTVNTNIRFSGVQNKTRPITKNTQGVVDDIEKLKGLPIKNKGVLFLAFPILHDNKDWQIQLQRIKANLKEIRFCPFDFKGNVPGVVYFGLI
jgi:hypothetical protein